LYFFGNLGRGGEGGRSRGEGARGGGFRSEGGEGRGRGRGDSMLKIYSNFYEKIFFF